MATGVPVINDEFVTMWYLTDKKIVHHKFHRFLFGEAFRRALDTGTELLRKHGACKWLSDDRANNALRPEDASWAKTDWFPRTMQAGWKYWALVMPEKIIGQMNMEQFVTEYSQQGLTVRVFSSPEEAMSWLEQQ